MSSYHIVSDISAYPYNAILSQCIPPPHHAITQYQHHHHVVVSENNSISMHAHTMCCEYLASTNMEGASPPPRSTTKLAALGAARCMARSDRGGVGRSPLAPVPAPPSASTHRNARQHPAHAASTLFIAPNTTPKTRAFLRPRNPACNLHPLKTDYQPDLLRP